jgi:maleate isomerase
MNEAVRNLKLAGDMVLIEHLPFATDDGIAARARIGLMVLATDYTIEHEWRRIMTPLDGVALYESRILNDNQYPRDAARHGAGASRGHRYHPPWRRLTVVASGCTSAPMATARRLRKIRLWPESNAPPITAPLPPSGRSAPDASACLPWHADANCIVAAI